MRTGQKRGDTARPGPLLLLLSTFPDTLLFTLFEILQKELQAFFDACTDRWGNERRGGQQAVYIIKQRAGDKVSVPPGWVHAVINKAVRHASCAWSQHGCVRSAKGTS